MSALWNMLLQYVDNKQKMASEVDDCGKLMKWDRFARYPSDYTPQTEG